MLKLRSNLSKLVEFGLFSRCNVPRLFKSTNDSSKKSHFKIAYAELKKLSEGIFTYPLKEDNFLTELQHLNQKSMPKSGTSDPRIIKFGPVHPAALGVLQLLLDLNDVKGRFGVVTSPSTAYLELPLYLETTSNALKREELIPYSLANEKNLNILVPKHEELIHKMFCDIIRLTDYKMGISATVLDCGDMTLLFWRFQDWLQLMSFCVKVQSSRLCTSHESLDARWTRFPLGFCPNLFEFPLRFVYSIEDLKEFAPEAVLEPPNYINYYEPTDKLPRFKKAWLTELLHRLDKMLKANEILVKSIHNMPLSDDSEKTKLEIQQSVRKLVHHFQDYKGVGNTAHIDARYIRAMHLEQVSPGVAGFGWFFAFFPPKF